MKEKNLPTLPASNLGNSSNEIRKRGSLAANPYRINGVLYADVLIQTERGTPQIVKGVQIEDQNTGIVVPLSTGKSMDLVWPDTMSYTRFDPAVARALPSTETPLYENQAIPASILSKLDKNAFLKAENGVCLQMNEAARNLQELARKIHERDGMVVIQAPGVPKSGGIVIDNDQQGSITQFDHSGNKVAIQRGQFQQDVNAVNSKGSDRGRNHPQFGGLPAQETFVADYVTKSNIMMPTPTHIPWVSEIVFLFGMIRMLLAVGKIAKKGLRDLKDINRAIDTIGEKERLEALSHLISGQELTDGDLKFLLGERAHYTDRSKLNLLKNTERIKALLPVLQDTGVLKGTEVENLSRLVNIEQSELRNSSSANSQRNAAFDKIANDANRRAKQAVQDYSKQGTSLDYSRIRGSLGNGQKNTFIQSASTPLETPKNLNDKIPILGA